MEPLELLSHATEFAFYPTGCAPTDPDALYFMVTVARRGEGRWAVVWMGECWNGNSWEYEALSSKRTDDFLERCRFPLDEAVLIAVEQADIVAIAGLTWAELQDLRSSRKQTD